jgi:hypothetical protein
VGDEDRVSVRGGYTGDVFDDGAVLTVFAEFAPVVKAYLGLFNTYVLDVPADVPENETDMVTFI